MTISDDSQNPKSSQNSKSSLEALAALRSAMEKRLSESKQNQGAKAGSETTPPPPNEAPSAAGAASRPAPETKTDAPSSPFAFPSATFGFPASFPETAAQMADPAEWSKILTNIAEQSQKMVQDFMAQNQGQMSEISNFDPAHIGEAFLELTNGILANPERFVDAQMALWQGYMRIWQSALWRMQGRKSPDVMPPPPGDKRFQDQEWQNNWLFDFLKQTYLLTAQQMQDWVRTESTRLDPRLARKLEFYTRQLVDAISPNNYWITNPEVLRKTFESSGENIIKGLGNLLRDLERGHGQLRISMTDVNAFRVGENLATTPGKVVYQNELMQLIQYAPLTPTVHKVPYLVIPPWINKYYILDLREKNSYIRYLVSQGHTVFCISWVNPDARHANVNFEDYMTLGALAAMREIRHLTGENNVNALGYCIGGTLLASTLAYLKGLPEHPADVPSVNSATYLVAMTDFAEPGDLGVFIDEDQIRAIESKMAKTGFLDAASLATTFSMLRANDLVWSFVINNYLLGKEPMQFDILYWNSDSTNLPQAMQSYYLRNMYKDNKLVQPGALSFKGVPLDLRRITTPTFMLSTREDHIAPWKSTYAATQIYQGPVTFVLAASGHIAGVVNPPTSKKYGYWTNDTCPPSPDDWLKDAVAHDGSWWPEWIKWLANYSGEQIPAREIRDGLENAPGSYVKVRAV